MENPIAVVTLVAWCFLLAAVVCGGEIFAASDPNWHTSPGECNHASGADQVHHSPLYKPNRRLRHTLNRRETLLNNTITSSPHGVTPNCYGPPALYTFPTPYTFPASTYLKPLNLFPYLVHVPLFKSPRLTLIT